MYKLTVMKNSSTLSNYKLICLLVMSDVWPHKLFSLAVLDFEMMKFYGVYKRSITKLLD